MIFSKPDSLFLLYLPLAVHGLHHMKREVPDSLESRASTLPIIVRNLCKETVWPGVATQAGKGPAETGFELAPGKSLRQTVSGDWQGRIWGRTNCTFDEKGNKHPDAGTSFRPGRACGTGDCNGELNCKVPGENPATLAEFTMDGGDGQCYYDISLVDGYNMPLAILMLPNGVEKLEAMPRNMTNPSCMGTASFLPHDKYDPYKGDQQVLGTNSSTPLVFENKVSQHEVSRWCPWDLQVNPPWKPGDGVYPYPDDNIVRPSFNPCLSACAKSNRPEDCCTGKYDSPSTCSPSLFSKKAKRVCPDAYSYAYDDQTSTFIIPLGAGFEIVFCPEGRSTNILASR